MFSAVFISSCVIAKAPIFYHYSSSQSLLAHLAEKMDDQKKPQKRFNVASLKVKPPSEMPRTNQWKQFKTRVKALRQYQVSNNFYLQLNSFKANALGAEVRQILKQNPKFHPKLSDGLESSKGYGVSFKLNFN